MTGLPPTTPLFDLKLSLRELSQEPCDSRGEPVLAAHALAEVLQKSLDCDTTMSAHGEWSQD